MSLPSASASSQPAEREQADSDAPPSSLLNHDADDDHPLPADDDDDDDVLPFPPKEDAKSSARRPLPWNQLLILSVCRLADPVALASVYPYLPEMIESFDVPAEKISTYAGVTSAVFSLAQACTGVLWGRASDTVGRKPVILTAMLCMVSSSVLFGFSRNLAWAIVARGLSGASNGNVGIMRTAVAELVPWKEGQPRAFSVMPVVWQVGSTIAPVIGGLLANPAEKYPGVFDTGEEGFWRRYPFALPNLVVAGFFAVGLSVGVLFLKETLESKRNKRDVGRVLGSFLTRPCGSQRRQKSRRLAALDEEQSASLLKHSSSSDNLSWHEGASTPHETGRQNHDTSPNPHSTPQEPQRVSWREIFTPQSNINLLAYTLLALHSIAYDQLLPVFMHYPSLLHNRQQQRQPQATQILLSSAFPHPIDTSAAPAYYGPLKFTGGFGIDSGRIGILFMITAGLGMMIQFLAFPFLCSRYGVLNNFKFVSVLFPLCYLVTPFTALLPSLAAQMAVIQVVMIVKCWAAIFAFPCSTILLTNSASSLRILGTLNGIAVSISALGRAAGPFMAGGLFTVGAECGYGILPWWGLAAAAIVAAVPIWWLVEEEGPNRDDRSRK